MKSLGSYIFHLPLVTTNSFTTIVLFWKTHNLQTTQVQRDYFYFLLACLRWEKEEKGSLLLSHSKRKGRRYKGIQLMSTGNRTK